VKRFLMGFLTASALFGGFLLWQAHRAPPPAAPGAPDAGASAAIDKRHRHRTAGAGGTGVLLRPGDLRPVSEGDNLSSPDVIDMGESGGSAGELSQEDVDARFRAHQSELLGCIDKARPSPDAAVVGKVVIKFRIQRAGTVRGVRVEGPSILMRAGLFGCIKPIVNGLRFPASGQSLIMTYPFQLD